MTLIFDNIDNQVTHMPEYLLIGGLEHEFYDFPFSWE